jgi:acetylornithine deacetylase/succinyl-diaminopimelate desuccinylase-like protein
MSRKEAIAAAKALAETRFLQELARRIAVKTESQNPDRLGECETYLKQIGNDLETGLGCATRIFANPQAGAGPILVARRVEDTALPTILIYGHGDVVPGMEGRWAKGRDPWAVTREGDRLYGRGTADNKGQHTIVLLALEAVLRHRGHLGFNATILLETAEETGSAGLHEFCRAERALLRADLLLASDGPRLAADAPTIVGGTRGVFDFDLVCALREGAHHSGNWGGLIANPAILLAHALATLVSKTGRIEARKLVPASVPESVRAALTRIDLEAMEREPAIDPAWGEPGLTPAERVFGWTALEVLAFTSGTPEQPVNAIPPRASARCQIRYTVDTDPGTFASAIREHLAAAGLSMVQVLPVRANPTWKATRLDPAHWAAQWAADSIEASIGRAPAVVPNAGGSLPNDCFAEILGMPTVWIPHSYPGCCQHAPDEHMLLSNVREGLAIMAGLFWDLGAAPPFATHHESAG